MKDAKKLIALLLALVMLFALAACGGSGSKKDEPKPTEAPAKEAAEEPAEEAEEPAEEAEEPAEEAEEPAEEAEEPAEEEAAAPAEGTEPEELGAGEIKWSEEKTPDGWMKVTNEGGRTLGYSLDSGVSLIQVDGLAFKDLSRDGLLQPYEDWRLTPEERARDLADRLTVEEMIPLFTHGGWMSFGSTITGQDLTYIEAGGRAGVTRSAGNVGNTGMAVDWTNALQSLCEATGSWGIPATVSVDPCSISYTIDKLSLGATFDVGTALELGKMHGRMYRAVGISMLLGPQIDITTTPVLDRAEGTFTEDPALGRDLADAYVSGLQSTWAEDGTDLGWGEDSVYAIVKHYAGAGAAEGGRNDHGDTGKFDVFPGDDFPAHLIPFFDGAFNLKGSVTHQAGVMPNYAISYSRNGSLGELKGGAYSAYKIGLLWENDYQGLIVTDFGIDSDGGQPYGVEDLTQAERFALLLKNGIHTIGGSSALDAVTEGFEMVVDELGEEEATALLRNDAYHFLLSQFQCCLFDNAYIELDHAYETVYNNETDAAALAMQEKTVIMLKNSGNVIHEADSEAEPLTVYIPYKLSSGANPFASMGIAAGPASWSPAMDLDAAAKYFTVVTDTLIGSAGGADASDEASDEASGDASAESGGEETSEEDIIRASAEELANCDLVIIKMQAPYTGSSTDSQGNYTPASLQYEAYTASTARRESIAADELTETINDGYGVKEQTTKVNRSYYNQTVGRDKNYGDLEVLQYVASVVPDTCKIVVLMAANQPMVWSEVEPLADVILLYYPGGVNFNGDWFFDEALLDIVSGKTEPYALLNLQQPASMEAVEAQKEDLPRDMECYVDADGNTYDFAFGLNWSGVIDDERVATYKVDPLTMPESIEFHYAE